MAHINDLGQEVLDQTPKCIPVPFHSRELTVFDRVRMQQAEFARRLAPEETPEDALDMGDNVDEYPDFESQPSRAELNEIRTQRVQREPEPKTEPKTDPEPPVDGE